MADEGALPPKLNDQLPPNYVPAPAPPSTASNASNAKKAISLRDRIHSRKAIVSESHNTIKDIVRKTRTPWGGEVPLGKDDISQLEKALAKVQRELQDREMLLEQALTKLDNREHDLKRMEDLLAAKEKVLAESSVKPTGETASPQQLQAMQRLKEEIDRRELELKEMQVAITERETFLEESENTLFDKMQSQQERETELDQREAELQAREAKLK